jgi:hypothetical protein
MSADHRLLDVSELAARKRFSVKPDPINGFCNVWRKREVLETDNGAERLTFEEAIELLNEWPDAKKKWRLETPKNEKLKLLGKRKNCNVYFTVPPELRSSTSAGRKRRIQPRVE